MSMLKIEKPVLLIDEDICRSNIQRMVKKSQDNHLEFRPHFKTHQSRKVGEWFKEEGVKYITVSSMDMAEYFIGDFDHITLAIPFNLLQKERLKTLLKKQPIAVLVDQLDTLHNLEESNLEGLGVWIEIDTGSKRSGVDPSHVGEIQSMIDFIEASGSLSIQGLYSHAGHTYRERSTSAVLKVFEDARNTLIGVQGKLTSSQKIRLNLGDTPGCSLSDNFEGLDSMSPGNFVFYDITQSTISSCKDPQIGVCLASPIISKNRERLEWVIYGGGIHLSKDRLEIGNSTVYGKCVILNEKGWEIPTEDIYLNSISQEHGVMKVSPEVFDMYNVGDLVGILPVHSCMTADCMGEYQSIDGEVIDHMRKCR